MILNSVYVECWTRKLNFSVCEICSLTVKYSYNRNINNEIMLDESILAVATPLPHCMHLRYGSVCKSVKKHLVYWFRA